MHSLIAFALVLSCALDADANTRHFDILIRNGRVTDGSGLPPKNLDIGILGEKIAALVPHINGTASTEIDATGLDITPGFVNMLSWAAEPLFFDGRASSEVLQGVTLEVFGEGWSLGPLSREMERDEFGATGNSRYGRQWTTLNEGLQALADSGVSPNIASLVGASTLRRNVLGHKAGEATPDAIKRMQALLRSAMSEGALGLGASLEGSPGYHATTQELTKLAQVIRPLNGLFAVHLRGEGKRLGKALEELIFISSRANVNGHIYHLKAIGENRKQNLENALQRINSARKNGIYISADIYLYGSAVSDLRVLIPPRLRAVNTERLRQPTTAALIEQAMIQGQAGWDNPLHAVGAENIQLGNYRSKRLESLSGLSLAQAARKLNITPEMVVLKVLQEQRTHPPILYKFASDSETETLARLPWITLGSDAMAVTIGGPYAHRVTHPRAFGNFVRFLKLFADDNTQEAWSDAIHRLTGLPARLLNLCRRGRIAPGFFADIVILDRSKLADHASYQDPQRYASGIKWVLVNGKIVVQNGAHTGATPGRVVRHRQATEECREEPAIHQKLEAPQWHTQ